MLKRRLLRLCLIVLSALCLNQINAQVGIGTNTPTNTLHLKPVDANEDPLRIEDLNKIMQGDSAFLVVDPVAGVVRYMPIGDLLNYVTFDVDQSNTNELQDASQVPLNPSFDIDSDGFTEVNVQEAITTLANKLPKGTFKSIGEARLAGLVDGDSFYTDPKGVFGCGGCIITLFEGME